MNIQFKKKRKFFSLGLVFNGLMMQTFALITLWKNGSLIDNGFPSKTSC